MAIRPSAFDTKGIACRRPDPSSENCAARVDWPNGFHLIVADGDDPVVQIDGWIDVTGNQQRLIAEQQLGSISSAIEYGMFV